MLKTVVVGTVPPGAPFAFTVPGHETWTVLSVVASAHRAVGGIPNRSYLLTVDDGTNPVALAPAADQGAEPGVGTITWANAPFGILASGAVLTVLAPLPALYLPAGYRLTGTIEQPAGADQWLAALVWVDYRLD